jgi:hypothetical protein
LGYFNPKGHLNGLLGIWMDQAHGVLPYTPLYLLAFWGFYFFWKKSRSDTLWLALTLLSIYLVAGGYREWWGGFCPPGRYLITLVPLLSLPLAYFMVKGPRPFTGPLFLITVLWGVWGAGIAFFNPKILYTHQTLFRESFQFPIVDIFFPNFLPFENANQPHDYLKSLIWIFLIVTAGIGLAGMRPVPPDRQWSRRTIFPMVLIATISASGLFYLVYPHEIKRHLFENAEARSRALRDFSLVKPAYSITEGSFFRQGLPKMDLSLVYPCAMFAHGNFRMERSPAGLLGDIVVISGDDTGGEPSIWGQYVTLPPGRYQAFFKVKVHSLTAQPSATLEVTREAGKVIEKWPIFIEQSDRSGRFQEFTLPFHLKEESRNMEFRIRVHPGALLWADTIKVEPNFIPEEKRS